MRHSQKKRNIIRRLIRRLGLYAIIVFLFVPFLLSRRITKVPEGADFSDNHDKFMKRFGDRCQEIRFTGATAACGLFGLFVSALDTPDPQRPCVLICHGLGGEIAQMLPQATMLIENGCDVFLFDMRGHGQSEACRTSLGYYESRDAVLAMDYLRREKGISKIILYGFSMGAVVAVLAAARDGKSSGVIAESPYDTLEEIVFWNARKMYRVPRFLVKIMLWATDVRRGSEYKEIDLRIALPQLKGVPMLLVGTADDQAVPIEMTRGLAPLLGDGQEYWETQGAEHGALLADEKVGDEFKSRINSLLQRCGR